MKPNVCFLIFTSLLVWITAGSAQTRLATPGQRQAYLMEMYRLTEAQARKYEDALIRTKAQDEQLRASRVSSDAFTEAHRKLIRKFQTEVSSFFDAEQYRMWSACVNETDRYYLLSHEKLVPKNRIYALSEAEKQWWDARAEMWKGTESPEVKYRRRAEMQAALQVKICEILGPETGRWYIEEKAILSAALANMDKYGATYAEGYRIARIEALYKQKRKNIRAEKIKRAEREEKYFRNDEERNKAVRQAVSPAVADKWTAIGRSPLDYILKVKYGLNKAQIVRFKTAYNVYTIEQHQILARKDRTKADKGQTLSEAYMRFCEAVRPLFGTDAFADWEGWQSYKFEKYRKQKGIY